MKKNKLEIFIGSLVFSLLLLLSSTTVWAELPYIAPYLTAAEYQCPESTIKANLDFDIDPTDFNQLMEYLDDPSMDSDGDTYSDLVEFLTGSSINDSNSNPEDFNLLLAITVDWNRDIDVSGTADIYEKATELDVTLPPSFVPYLSPTLETQFSGEICQLAADLNYDPVKIYKYVYENIEFEDYELSRKGALSTLRSGKGNEWDQCSLLIALFRISGIPARYVIGRQYEVVPGLPDPDSEDEENPDPYMKDCVIVQAWTTPLMQRTGNIIEDPLSTWISLVPWFKNQRIVPGLDIFQEWDETTETMTTSIPSELELRDSSVPSDNSYLIPEFLNGSDNFGEDLEAHIQQTSMDFLEKLLQDYIGSDEYGKSIKELYRKEQTLELKIQHLPYTLPYGLVQRIPYSTNKLDLDQVASDIGEFEDKRVKTDLKIARVLPDYTSDDIAKKMWGRWKFDESSGETVHSSAPVGISGWPAGSWTGTRIDYNDTQGFGWNPDDGKIGGAINFDGDESIQLSEGFSNQPLSSGTFMAWIKISDENTYSCLFDYGDSQDGFKVMLAGGSLSMSVYSSYDERENNVWLPNIPYNEWHHVGVSFMCNLGGSFTYRMILDGWSFTRTLEPLAQIQANDDLSALGGELKILAPDNIRHDHKFKGLMDDARFYADFLDEDQIIRIWNQSQGDMFEFSGDKSVLLPQVSGRRFILEFEKSPQNFLDERLLLDGAIFSSGNPEDNFPVGSDGLSQDSFHVSYRFPQAENPNPGWFSRPAIRAGAHVNFMLDAMGCSEETVFDLQEELANLDSEIVLSDDFLEREPYLGRFSDMLGELFGARANRYNELADDIFNVKHLHKNESREFVMIWTYPGDPTGVTSNQIDDLSTFRLAGGWQIDARFTFPHVYHPEHPSAVYDLESPLGHYIGWLSVNSSSLDEARIFEDTQGTPSLSTVRGLFDTFKDTGNSIVMFNGTESETQIRAVLDLDTDVVDQIVNEVVNYGATVHTTQNEVAIYYPEGHPDEGDVAIQSDVRIVDTPTNISWIYGDFGGGRSADSVDPNESIEVVTDALGFDFSGTNDLLLRQSTVAGAEGDVINTWQDEQVARSVYLGGDPVDLVTGEFYYQEPADISIRSRGFPLSISRKYKSQAVYDGPFGFGWTWNHAESLTFVRRQDNPDLTDIIFYDSERNPYRFSKSSGEQPSGGQTPSGQATTVEMTGIITFTHNEFGPDIVESQNSGGFSIFVVGDDFTVIGGDNNGESFTILGMDASKSVLYLEMDQSVISGWDTGVILSLTGSVPPPPPPPETVPLDEYKAPPGVTLTLSEDTDDQGNPIFTIKSKTGNSMTFSEDGRLLSKSDILGNSLTFEYDNFSRITAIKDTLSRDLELVYNQNDKVSEVHDYTGRVTYYSYDGDDLVSFEDLAGNVWQYEYLEQQENPLNNHNISKITLPDGDFLNITYYKNDTVALHRNREGSEYHFQYSWYNRYTETWTEEGYYQKIFYDYFWNVIRIQKQDKSVEFREYDTEHNLSALIDGRGNRTEYRYDDARNLVAIINPKGETWVYGYEPELNRKTVEIDPKGVVSIFKYNAKGQLEKAVTATEKLADEVTFTDGLPVYDLRIDFDSNGDLVDDNVPSTNEILDYPERGEIRFVYDTFGNLVRKTQVLLPDDGTNPEVVIESKNIFDIYGLNQVKAIDPRGYEIEYFYDDLNRLIAVKDQAGYTSQTEYTNFNSVHKSISPNGAVTEYVYDENRRVKKVILPNGGEIDTVYGSRFYVDHQDRVLSVTDPLGYKVQHAYDFAGRRVASTDKNGNTTRFIYDAEDRVISTVNAMGDSMHFTYDGNGNKTSSTDFMGNTVAYQYDEANHLVLSYETWEEKRAVAYEYDANGKHTSISRGYINGEDFMALDRQELFYDARNHLIKVVANAAENDRRITKFGFDSIGRKCYTIEGGYNEIESDEYFIRRTTTVYDENDNVIAVTITGWDEILNEWIDEEIIIADSEYDERNLLSKSWDPNGTPTSFEYDAAGRLLSATTNITDADGTAIPHIKKNTYDVMGNVILSQQFVALNETTRSRRFYNLRNEAVRFEDAQGKVSSAIYDGNGNVTETTDPAGNSSRTYYDALNRVSAVENALGETAYSEFDANGNLITVTTPSGERTINAYNNNNERVSVTDPVGNTKRFVYDTRGRLVFKADPRFTGTLPSASSIPPLYTSKYIYNDFDEVVETQTPVTLLDDTVETVQTFVGIDDLGKIFSNTDARGVVTENDLDILDRITEIRQAAGTDDESITRNYYDLNGNVLMSIRGVGTSEQVATYTRYDEANRVIESSIGELSDTFDPVMVNPAIDEPVDVFKVDKYLTTTTGYYTSFNSTSIEITDPYGMKAISVFDNLGRLTSKTDKAGKQTTFSYDSRGNLVETRFPSEAPDAPITNKYDALNRVVETTQAGVTTSRKYDASNRLIESRDGRGYITHNVYDTAGRLIRTTRAYGTVDQVIQKFAYDAANNLVKVIDGNHTIPYAPDVSTAETPIALYEYDELSRKVREWDASGAEGDSDGEISYLYDNGGLPLAVVKRDGLLIERGYDNLRRLKTVYTTEEGSSAQLQQEFRYDKLSRLKLATDYNSGLYTHTVDYTYDFASRVTDEEIYDNDLGHPEAGRVVSTSWASAPGDPSLSQIITKTYPFSNRGQVRKLDERGKISIIEDLSGHQISNFDYDSLNRPSEFEARNSSSATVLSGSADYDTRGREASRLLYKNGTEFLNQDTAYDASSNVESETISGILPTINGYKSYQHDPLNRLTSQDNPGSIEDLNWTLDAEGNWLSTNQNGAPESRSVNDDNEYENIGTTVVDYDSNGNITQYGDRAFDYDWLNRMTAIWDVSGGLPGTLIAAYSYDAANRRIKRTYGSVTTTYVMDGSQVVQELENGTIARTFIYGSYIDSPVFMYDETSGGSQYFYVRDRRANIVGILDDQGSVVERYEYTPFGTWTVYNASGTALTGTAFANPYGFSGRRWDAESGLWYYRNRVYSAQLGRFLSRDPAGFVDGYNLYGYVGNNPMYYTDPYGLFGWMFAGRHLMEDVWTDITTTTDYIWNEPLDASAVFSQAIMDNSASIVSETMNLGSDNISMATQLYVYGEIDPYIEVGSSTYNGTNNNIMFNEVGNMTLVADDALFTDVYGNRYGAISTVISVDIWDYNGNYNEAAHIRAGVRAAGIENIHSIEGITAQFASGSVVLDSFFSWSDDRAGAIVSTTAEASLFDVTVDDILVEPFSTNTLEMYLGGEAEVFSLEGTASAGILFSPNAVTDLASNLWSMGRTKIDETTTEDWLNLGGSLWDVTKSTQFTYGGELTSAMLEAEVAVTDIYHDENNPNGGYAVQTFGNFSLYSAGAGGKVDNISIDDLLELCVGLNAQQGDSWSLQGKLYGGIGVGGGVTYQNDHSDQILYDYQNDLFTNPVLDYHKNIGYTPERDIVSDGYDLIQSIGNKTKNIGEYLWDGGQSASFGRNRRPSRSNYQMINKNLRHTSLAAKLFN